MKNNLPSKFLDGGYGAIFVTWLLFELLWFLYLGVHFDLEAEKYIREANFILQHHHFSEARYLFYLSTTAVIALCNTIGLGLYGALTIIMALNLFSYFCFYRALQTLFKKRLVAYCVVFLLLSFWPYQSWTLYLYTECFFYSAVLLLFSHLILYKGLTFRFLFISFLLLVLVIISRPLGILFVLPTLLFIFFHLSKKQRLFFSLAIVLSLILFNYIVQTVFTTTSDWSLQKTITEADIVCDIPGPGAGAKLILSKNSNQLYQLFYYVTHNFSHFAMLALVRLKYFYTMVRSYYSGFHNAFLMIYLLPMYASILIGFRKIVSFLPTALAWFIFSTIVLFSVTTALQCDDYHNRFILTLMPFFMTMTVIVLLPWVCNLPFFKNKIPIEK